MSPDAKQPCVEENMEDVDPHKLDFTMAENTPGAGSSQQTSGLSDRQMLEQIYTNMNNMVTKQDLNSFRVELTAQVDSKVVEAVTPLKAEVKTLGARLNNLEL